jgi:hypothetical protein
MKSSTNISTAACLTPCKSNSNLMSKSYNIFKEGDEVFTKKKFKAITPNRPYTIIRCYRPTGFVESCPIIMIEMMTDRGFISRYATTHFLKTELQIRDDKLSGILHSEGD